ncbi:MAG: hypothetical protein KDA84_02885, partial [Planctomycetaceae bacterium]|nr:hypothetical protein [Planctomycetaceae bacterium]
MALLEGRGIAFRQDPATSVREIDFQVDAGELVCLLSSNRGRLHTLYCVLAGLLRPQVGSIFFQEKEISRWSTAKRLAAGLVSGAAARNRGRLQQLWRKTLTVEQELLRIGAAAGAPVRLTTGRALLEQYGLLDFRGTPVDGLPHAKRFDFDLACSLLWKPRVLLIDAPFLNAESAVVTARLATLQKLREEGMGVVVTEANFEAMRPICNRFCVLAQGRQIGYGSSEQLAESLRAKEMYIWPILKRLHSPVEPEPNASATEGIHPKPPTASRKRSLQQKGAFSPVSVVTRYPLPIAAAYRRFCRQHEPVSRLTAGFSVVEALLKYLAAVGISNWLTSHPDQKTSLELFNEDTFKFLRSPRPMSLGNWLGVVRELGRNLSKFPESFCPEFGKVCHPTAPLLDTIFSKLISARNDFVHPRQGFPYTPEQCNKTLGEIRPLLDQSIHLVEFLADFPLGFFRKSRVQSDSIYR